MSLSEADVERFIELVQADPLLRDRVREAIVGADMQALPGLIRELVEHGRLVDQRLEQLAARMDQLTTKISQMDGRLGNVEGMLTEEKYIRRLGARLGSRFKRVRVVEVADLDQLDEAYASGTVSEGERRDALRLDATAWARDIKAASPDPVLLAVEVSRVVDRGDVLRAHRRAAVLRTAGLPAIAVVDGRSILDEARDLLIDLGVVSFIADWLEDADQSGF